MELRIVQTSGGTGSPGGRRALEIGGIEWNVVFPDSNVKTIDEIVNANIKTWDALAAGSIKTINGINF